MQRAHLGKSLPFGRIDIGIASLIRPLPFAEFYQLHENRSDVDEICPVINHLFVALLRRNYLPFLAGRDLVETVIYGFVSQ